MARYTFGGTIADFAASIGPGGTLRAVPATLTFWDAETGGTQITDLLLDGAAVSTIAVPVGGQIPDFQGPDEVTELWADAGGGRVRMVAEGRQGPPGLNADGTTADQAMQAIDADPASAYRVQADARLVGRFAAVRAVREMAWQGREPLHPSYAWSPTTMSCVALGQNPSTGQLWGVNQGTAKWAYSDDGGATWTDAGATTSPVKTGGSMEFVSAGPYIVLVTAAGELFRTTKTSTPALAEWGNIGVTEARSPGTPLPAGTTGREQVFASNDVSGSGSVWLYGNYNGAASGSWPGAYIWRSTNYGVSWTRATLDAAARHVHAVAFDPDDLTQAWATVGDDTATGAGLYHSTDAGVTWTKVSSNRYAIGIDFLPDTTGYLPDRLILEGDGTAQAHMFAYDLDGSTTDQDPLTWYDDDPVDGLGAWKGSARALRVTSEGNIIYASLSEGGAIGTRDGLWIARGPHFGNVRLLQEYTGGVIPTWRRTFEWGEYVINGSTRSLRPRFRDQV